MFTYIGRRLLSSIPVLLMASFAIFALIRVLPGDPVSVLAGPDARDEVLLAVREKYGLDKPLLVQYWIWGSMVLSGDLGTSLLSRLPVARLIGQAFPATLELAFVSFLITLIVGVPLGVVAATRANSSYDQLITNVAAFLTGVPGFWLGLLLILAFSVNLQWFPPSGRIPLFSDFTGAMRHLALPVLSLTPRLIAVLFLFVRSATMDVRRQDFVRTAISKGLSARTVSFKHVLRNALIPVITVLSVQFSRLLAGAVVIETVFAWPGLGRMLVNAVINLDYPVVQAALLLLVGLFIVLNTLTDILYGIADPRIQVGASASR